MQAGGDATFHDQLRAEVFSPVAMRRPAEVNSQRRATPERRDLGEHSPACERLPVLGLGKGCQARGLLGCERHAAPADPHHVAGRHMIVHMGARIQNLHLHLIKRPRLNQARLPIGAREDDAGMMHPGPASQPMADARP